MLLNANGSNFGSMYITFDPFHDRHGPDLYSDAIIAKLRAACAAEVPDAIVAAFGAPPVDGLGNAGGFKFYVEDIGSTGLDSLQQQTDNLIVKGNQTPGLVGLFSSFRANTPQLYVDVNREKCKTLGLALNDVFTTLQVYLGGYYVNDFNKFGRTWQVNLQADARSTECRPKDVRQLQVRNAAGKMVPLGTVVDVQDIGGPVMVTRYNTYTAAAVNGNMAPGTSTGQAIAAVKGLADKELPKSMSFEWTELTYMQILAGSHLRPASRAADSAATTANSVKRSISLRLRRSSCALGSQSRTSAAMRQRKPVTSKALVGPTPLRPASSAPFRASMS